MRESPRRRMSKRSPLVPCGRREGAEGSSDLRTDAAIRPVHGAVQAFDADIRCGIALSHPPTVMAAMPAYVSRGSASRRRGMRGHRLPLNVSHDVTTRHLRQAVAVSAQAGYPSATSVRAWIGGSRRGPAICFVGGSCAVAGCGCRIAVCRTAPRSWSACGVRRGVPARVYFSNRFGWKISLLEIRTESIFVLTPFL